MSSARTAAVLCIIWVVSLSSQSAGAVPEQPLERGEACALIGRLKSSPTYMDIVYAAEIGEAARGAGPILERLINHVDDELYLPATRALGFLGYVHAADELTSALNNPTDWRRQCAAAESLGRMKVESARSALQQQAGTSSFSPVRYCAAKALAALDGQTTYGNFATTDFSGFMVPEGLPGKPMPMHVEETYREKFRQPSSADRFTTAVLIPPHAQQEGEQLSGDAMATEVEDGTLAWIDNGEWGGVLVHIPRGGDGETSPVILLREQVKDLLSWPGYGLFAVTGIAHLALDEGAVYKVQKVGNTWSATRWRTLPAASASAWITTRNELFVNTSWGAVLLTKDGAMQLVEETTRLE